MTETEPWSSDVQVIAWDHGPMEFVRTGFGGVCYFRSPNTTGRTWWFVGPGPRPIIPPPRGIAR